MSDIDSEEYPVDEWPYKHWDTFSRQWLPCRDKYVKVPDETTPWKISKTIRAKPRTQKKE